MDMKQFIGKRREYLQRWIAEKEAAVINAPCGGLGIKPQDNKVYFVYRPSRQEGGQQRYLKTTDARDMALARAIAQRDYDQQVLKTICGEERIIARLIRHYEKGQAEEIYGKLGSARQSLVTPIRLTDEQYAEKWQDQELGKAVMPQDVPVIETAGGERVRSKSELFIADALFKHGIKYHYECAVETIDHLTGMPKTRYPDFLALNARTRKTYYWEHFGKCDDPDYVNDNLNKLIDYQDVGIVQGINLIMTFETRSIPFTPDKAEQIIKSYLL